MPTFYSVPCNDVSRVVVFDVISDDLQDFVMDWNSPIHGHVLMMQTLDKAVPTVSITNTSNERMIILVSSDVTGTFIIGFMEATETISVEMSVFKTGVLHSIPCVVVLEDTFVFKCTAYLHRKKITQPYYAREEILCLPKGVYMGIGHVAATLNQEIVMRGERNGYIYHFVTHGGKLSVEASHKQPEPSFMEIVPLHNGLGLLDQDVVRLRTKERLDFPYAPLCLI
jgi:hypothetical protein